MGQVCILHVEILGLNSGVTSDHGDRCNHYISRYSSKIKRRKKIKHQSIPFFLYYGLHDLLPLSTGSQQKPAEDAPRHAHHSIFCHTCRYSMKGTTPSTLPNVISMWRLRRFWNYYYHSSLAFLRIHSQLCLGNQSCNARNQTQGSPMQSMHLALWDLSLSPRN